MKKYSSILFLLLLALGAVFQVSAQRRPVQPVGCRVAGEKDFPLGGNELITFAYDRLKKIRGVVTIGGLTEGAEDVVVEIYDVTGQPRADIEQNAERFIQDKKRIFGCVTDSRGIFGFQGLSKGIYILKIGTNSREKGYFNYIYIIIGLDPKKGRNQKLEFYLQAAT